MRYRGYDVIDRQLIVNEPEAEQVRELFSHYLDLAGVDDLVAYADAQGILSKARTGGKGAAGQPTGGTKLGRGSLYRILANPIYAGEIGHKGKTYPGQHQRIVDQPLYDAVQAKLAANRRKGRGKTTTAAPAMLSGLVVGADGERLASTHTGRHGKRYRYYAGGDVRLPGPELEALVSDTLVGTLSSPAKLAAVLPDPTLLTPDLIAAASKHAITLQRATAGQRRRSAVALIYYVKVNPTAVVIGIKLAALGSAGIADIVVPASIGRSRAGLTLVVPGPRQPRPDVALIGMVAQARGWFERIVSGEHQAIETVAKTEGVTPAYVRQTIGAAFLAPDIVTSIVEGRQPPALTATRLKELLPLPAAWPEQRVLIASLA